MSTGAKSYQEAACAGRLMNEPQQSEMQRQMEFLRSCVGRLSKAISDLEDKLLPVMCPSPPETPMNRVSENTNSPLTEEISMSALDIDRMLDRITIINGRLTI